MNKYTFCDSESDSEEDALVKEMYEDREYWKRVSTIKRYYYNGWNLKGFCEGYWTIPKRVHEKIDDEKIKKLFWIRSNPSKNN